MGEVRGQLQDDNAVLLAYSLRCSIKMGLVAIHEKIRLRVATNLQPNSI